MVNKTKSSANKKTASSVKLSAEIGTEMQVEIANSGSRIKLTMVGIVPGDYLLFQIPEKHISPKSLKAFTKNTVINIRSISRGIAFGFNSTILGVTTSPDTLLFANYPDNIQQQSIRKNQRVKCLLPAKLSQDSTTVIGTLADLSSSGCHFQTKKAELSNEQIAILQPETLINIAISLPAIEENKVIAAQIKNTFTDANKAQIGIEFIEIDEAVKILIEDFVNMSFDLSPF